MTGDWKVGQVALVEAGCWANTKVALRLDEGWSHVNGVSLDDDGIVTPIRPLAVIDPEDRQAVERLFNRTFERGGGPSDLQAALREFAAPTPPRPNEPKGLGAVVEDANGRLWLRDHFEGAAEPRWFWAEGVEDGDWLRCDYSDIDVVRVLSEGIEQP